MNENCKNSKTLRKHVGGKTGFCFRARGILLIVMLTFLTIVLQSLSNSVQAKALLRSKTGLKFLQTPLSLIQQRPKRDTFSHEQQQRQEDRSDYYDDNYDVLPDMPAGAQPATLGDQISEQAKQVAESFKSMWQSLADSVRHCVNALGAMFGEDLDDDEELTPEQEREILANLEDKHRLQQQHENEPLSNVYRNQV